VEEDGKVTVAKAEDEILLRESNVFIVTR